VPQAIITVEEAASLAVLDSESRGEILQISPLTVDVLEQRGGADFIQALQDWNVE
jgi:hypothetical protein